MLSIKNLSVILADSKKEILNNINLTVQPGEIHLLNGMNGSGKSTLVNTIMGNPNFKITAGQIEIIDEEYSNLTIEKIDPEIVAKTSRKDIYHIDLTNAEANERSLCGIFLANQYPVEIPGLSLTSYLRLIYNSRRAEDEVMPVFKFKKFLEERAEIINYPKALLKRNLNEGFSGGEKKKTEILQMLMLEPRYIMLDEIDSGLDRQSVKDVFNGLSEFKKLYPGSSFVIITHYDRAQEYLKIDFTHEMFEGSLAKSQE